MYRRTNSSSNRLAHKFYILIKSLTFILVVITYVEVFTLFTTRDKLSVKVSSLGHYVKPCYVFRKSNIKSRSA